MRLSKRLKRIAAKVEHDAIVYDVGCDHALLSCYLVKENIAKKVYAGDNKAGPLRSAAANIEASGLKDKVIPILADGLKKAPEDVDTVIIAGMGFNTLKSILDETDVRRFKRFIVQINHQVSELRAYISDHGYRIIDEEVVFDGFYYEIIVFDPTDGEKLSDLEIAYGPILLARKDEVFIDYLKDRKRKLANILKNHDDTAIKEAIEKIRKIIE